MKPRSPLPQFVSCVMPTRNRPELFEQALRCYRMQTWPRSELIVVDDGDRPVARLCRGVPGVRYCRLPKPQPTGAKMNIGIEWSRGAVIQKLDDDDYYHPRFLKTALTRLLDYPSVCRPVVAWCCFLLLIQGEPEIRASGHGWRTGSTLCFHRRLWDRRPFRPITFGEDRCFLEDNRARLVRVCARDLVMVTRHPANTSTRMCTRAGLISANDYFRGLPASGKTLEDVVADPDSRRFYRRFSN